MLLTFRDLTPIRRVEEMRVDFVANASHELRTPLAALSGFIETLQGPARNDTAARERFLDIMEAQAKRMARLIDDLLSLSRIELAAHVRPETPVELCRSCAVIDALQMLARDRGVDGQRRAPEEPLIVLRRSRRTDPGVRESGRERAEIRRVRQARRDHAGVRRGRRAASRSAGRGARLGPGIAPSICRRLTERFYRVDVAESRAQGGTGLGLALVKHILNRHRGRLSIDSLFGEGATFTIHLPITAAAAAPALNHS